MWITDYEDRGRWGLMKGKVNELKKRLKREKIKQGKVKRREGTEDEKGIWEREKMKG